MHRFQCIGHWILCVYIHTTITQIKISNILTDFFFPLNLFHPSPYPHPCGNHWSILCGGFLFFFFLDSTYAFSDLIHLAQCSQFIHVSNGKIS